MMKKRNEEGYVLAYVMVIILVVCSIAVALMSYSLNTIQTQENMVQRMKDKYEAMGEIERVAGELTSFIPLDPETGNKLSGVNTTQEDSYNDAIEALTRYLTSDSSPFPFESFSYCNDPSDEHYYGKLLSTIVSNKESVSISAELLIEPTIIVSFESVWFEDFSPEDNSIEDGNFRQHDAVWKYEISSISFLDFDSYHVSSTGGAT